MRTYIVSYLDGTRIIFSCKMKAPNKRECMRAAKQRSLPTTQTYTSIFIKVIKNKGDK